MMVVHLRFSSIPCVIDHLESPPNSRNYDRHVIPFVLSRYFVRLNCQVLKYVDAASLPKFRQY